MFRAIRSWWRGGRGKVTARLFLFELCVVVLGVLIAQGLASFAQRQSDYANMEEERSRALYELESAHQVVRAWSAAVPCLNARMDEVIDGRPLSAGDLRRPALSQPRFSPIVAAQRLPHSIVSGGSIRPLLQMAVQLRAGPVPGSRLFCAGTFSCGKRRSAKPLVISMA